MDDTGVLTRRDMGRVRETAGEQALLRLQHRLLYPRFDSGPGRLRQLELDRPLRLSLHDHRTGQNLVAVRDVANTQIDEVATPQFAVDREVEHCQVANLMRALKLNTDCPDVLRLERRLLTDQLAFVPGFPVLSGFHDRLLRC